MPKTSPIEELLGEAIAETEREIAADAWNDEPAENDGDRSLEEVDEEEGIPSDGDEGDEDDTEADGEGDEEPEGEDEPEGEEDEDEPEPQRGRDAADQRRGVPSERLRQEAEARRTAEAERDAERQRLRALEAEIETLKRASQPKPEQPEKPDIFADPDAWAREQRETIERSITERHVNASFAETAEEHGDAFAEAFRALTAQNPADPLARAAVQRVWNAPNPGKALMRWHGEQQMLREIGGDPQGYERKVAERLLADPDYRRELTARLSDDARAAGRTRVERQIDTGRRDLEVTPRQGTQRRLPPSLNSATGGTAHRSRDSASRSGQTTASIEQEIFDSAWE